MTLPLPLSDLPPDYLPKNWWEWLANQGLGVTVLCVGLFVVGKLLLISQTKLSALQEQRIKELTEQNQNQEKRIQTLEVEIRDCKEDRRDLRLEVDSLKKRSVS